MSQSINYYIALSDELSTAIDGMSKEELAVLAYEVMHWYTKEHNTMTELCHKLMMAVPEKDCILLAHGLLAKAI